MSQCHCLVGLQGARLWSSLLAGALNLSFLELRCTNKYAKHVCSLAAAQCNISSSFTGIPCPTLAFTYPENENLGDVRKR